jgi:predicted secreted Zn-dependent protease
MDGTEWVGTIHYTSTYPDGTPGPPGSFVATRLVTGQSVGDMHYSMTSNLGSTGTCDGIMDAATSSLTWDCSYAAAGGACTGTASHTDPVNLTSTPPTMTVDHFAMTWGGFTCGIAGQTWTFAGTFTQQQPGP